MAVHAIRKDRRGRLWVGTVSGLERLDPGEGIFFRRAGRFTRLRAPDYLPSETVLSFFEDIESGVWVGTQTVPTPGSWS